MNISMSSSGIDGCRSVAEWTNAAYAVMTLGILSVFVFLELIPVNSKARPSADNGTVLWKVSGCMVDHPLWKAFISRRVFGFHGNTAGRIAAAEEHGFRRDGLPGDWLGSGLYFWLEAPARAWQWAEGVVAREIKVHPDASPQTPKVILAELEYNEYWIDLIESGPWVDRLKGVAIDLERRGVLPDQSAELPASVLHNRDYAVIESAMNALSAAGIRVDAIRCAFVEGDPICERSAIYDKAHVQIAVRNPAIIGDHVSIEREMANQDTR